MDGKTIVRLIAAALFVVAAVAPASAEVVVFEEFVNLETSATSACPDDPVPEPDTSKHWVHELIGTSPDIHSEMMSACGVTEMGSRISVSRTATTITGNFGVSSSLVLRDGGVAGLGAYLRLVVDVPTTYALSCVGTTVQTDDPDFGSMEFMFRGGTIEHASNGEHDFDHDWAGTLQPGVEYSLTMDASSTRFARSLPNGQFIPMDGTTDRTVVFTLTVGGEIVEADDRSMGQIKTRY